MIDLTKIKELVKVSSLESVNALLKSGMVLLAIEDGEYILARLK